MANEEIKVIADKEDIVAIADAIRTVSGETEAMSLADMPTKIMNAGSGGSSVETCIVTIDDSFKKTGSCTFIKVINGVPTLIEESDLMERTETTHIFEGVLANSFIFCATGGYSDFALTPNVDWFDVQTNTYNTGGYAFFVPSDGVTINITR